MKATVTPHVVVTKIPSGFGPRWSGTLFTCPQCATSIISDWKDNADSHEPFTEKEELRLRRKFFPHYYQER